MFDRDKWQEIFGTMAKHKLRTGLTALGVFWGIFMLIFILGMGAGLENGVFRDFVVKAKNIMYVNAWTTSKPYKGYPPGRRIQMKIDDVEALKANISEIDQIATRRSLNNTPISYLEQNSTYELRGETPSMIDIERLVVKQGRYINPGDYQEARKVCVIGDRIREVLFGDEDCLGKYIRVKGIPFVVVGVFGPMKLEQWTQSDMESVVIPLTTFYRSFGSTNKIDYMIVSSKPGIRVSDMEEKVRQFLKERHDVAPDDPEGIGGWNLEEEFDQVKNLFIGIKGFLWFVGIGTLLAGIVGVSNIMLIIVKERTKEIGIRKALGASPGSTISMILTESIFITSVSGYFGLMAGTLVVGGFDYIMEMNDVYVENFHNPEVNLTVGVGSVLTLIIAGTLAGLIPAIQASSVDPVKALKDE